MDVLSDILETLELRCTSVQPTNLGGTESGDIVPMLAYIVVAGSLTLRFPDDPAGDDPAEFALGPLDCILLAGGDEHKLQSGGVESSSPTRLLRCEYAFPSWPGPIRSRGTSRGGCAFAPGT